MGVADQEPILLSSGAGAPDCSAVYQINGHLVLKVSPSEFPNVVRELIEQLACVREALGEELRWAMPLMFDQWEIDGITCALIERLIPLSENRLKRFMQRRQLIPAVLAWLQKIAQIDRGKNREGLSYLKILSDCPYEALGKPAKDTLAAVSSKAFVARSRVMHGDLWLGNIMLDPSGKRDFVVIDWRGSDVDGLPIFDLVKFSESTRLHPKILLSELSAHAQRIGCEVQDTRTYLLMALGYIWHNLDQFPPDRFAAMGVSCLKTIDLALNA